MSVLNISNGKKHTLKEHTGNFTIIDNEIFHRKDISMKSRFLLCLMLSLSKDWRFSIRGLASMCSVGESTIRNCLKELVEKGYVKRTPYRNKRGLLDCFYDIYEVRELNSEENSTVDIEEFENNETEFEEIENEEISEDEITETNETEDKKFYHINSTVCSFSTTDNHVQLNTNNKVTNNKESNNININNNIIYKNSSSTLSSIKINNDYKNTLARNNEDEKVTTTTSVANIVNETMSDVNNDESKAKRLIKEQTKKLTTVEKTKLSRKKSLLKYTRERINDERILECLNRYIDMHHDSFFLLSKASWESKLNQLLSLSDDVNVLCSSIENSILRSNRVFYIPNEYNNYNKHTSNVVNSTKEIQTEDVELAVDEDGKPILF